MKNVFLKLILFALCAALLFSLAACGGTGDGTQDAGGDITDITPPTGDSSDVEDPENLVLIKDSTAKFSIVVTGTSDASVVKVVQSFISDLSDVGVDVDDYVNDSDKGAVSDCEIIIGTDVKNRDAKYVLNPRDYGADGYVIKVVDNKVLIGGGNSEQTKAALEYFIKSVVKLTSKTKELSDLKVERGYEKLKETKYLIESITVDGADLSEFVFVTDLGDYKIKDFESINDFRENLYAASGYWLASVKPDSVPDGAKAINVRYVSDAGENGFRVYVDSLGNLNVECAYMNAFDGAFEHFADATFYQAIGDVKLKKSFELSYNVSVVYYSQFGAVGDGTTNDAEAIYNTHVFANRSGQTVMGDKGKTYYIFDLKATTPVKTNVDWNGAKFVVEDRGSVIFNQRGTHLFSIQSDYTAKSFSENEIKTLFGDKTLSFGDTEIMWLADYVEGTSIVTLRNQHEDFIRWGGHVMSHERQDTVIIEPDGKLHEDTPIIWDFYAGEQLVNTGRRCEINVHSNFSYISIRRVDDEPITVKNGYFERFSNEVVPETQYQNTYAAYGRGIAITRSNVTVHNVDHKIVWEPEMPISGYGQNEKGEFKQGYPYGGFLVFSSTYNSSAIGCDLNAHTCFYEHKDSTATPTAMGSYDLNITGSSNIYLEGITNGVDHCDSQYWGIMHSNESKNLTFKNCVMNRFDAHEGVWSASFENCEFGFTLNLIGGGDVKIVNTVRNVGTSFISMRVDYGSTFNGTLEIIDCTLEGKMAYRGGAASSNYGKYYGASEPLFVVTSSYQTESTYNSVFNYNNMQTFPYLKWDFGYQRYLPRDIIIDNFTCTAENYGAKLYLYPNYDDACFVKPEDFVQRHDYENIDVLLPDGTTRPMTEDDVFYGPLVMTRSVTYRNMSKAIPICPDDTLLLHRTLTAKLKIEND